jgi:hypothetical protein
MASSLFPRRRRRLIRRLQAARQSLAAWDSSLRNTLLFTESTGDAPAQAETMLALVADARHAVDRRLAELGVAADELARPAQEFARSKTTPRPPRDADPAMSAYRVCVNACHACGRALGAAFREAQAVADAASARILYGSLRAFEKQIWVLDPGYMAH